MQLSDNNQFALNLMSSYKPEHNELLLYLTIWLKILVKSFG